MLIQLSASAGRQRLRIEILGIVLDIPDPKVADRRDLGRKLSAGTGERAQTARNLEYVSGSQHLPRDAAAWFVISSASVTTARPAWVALPSASSSSRRTSLEVAASHSSSDHPRAG